MNGTPQEWSEYVPTGRRMIKSVSIRNFRCFASAELKDCRTINIVTGENGSGKTALLEAIFLALARNPEVPLRFRRWRGFEEGQFTASGALITEWLWSDLFHGYDKTKTVSVSISGSGDHNKEVSITQGRPDLLSSVSHIEEYQFPLVILRKDGDSAPSVTTMRLVNGRLQFFTNVPFVELEPTSESFFFAANHTYSSLETAQRFSELSKRQNHRPAIEWFTEQFPQLKDMSVELGAGKASVFASLEGTPRKVPINAISGGITKLAAILFAIPEQRGSVVIVDEIESGFYYRRLPAIWKLFLDFAERYDAQIFASTHSMECLQAAAQAAEVNPDAFSLIQTGNDGVRQMSGATFVDAMKFNIEIR